MTTNEIKNTLTELMEKYNEYRAKWIEFHGNDEGFNEWFTSKVFEPNNDELTAFLVAQGLEAPQPVKIPDRNIDDWPYPLIGKLYKSGSDLWVEVSERIYTNQLECLPPAAWKGYAFAMGEAATHTPDGKPVHTIFVAHRGRYFARDAALSGFDPVAYTKEIKAQFGI